MKYPNFILALQTFKGFKEAYLDFLPEAKTYEEAYEQVECMYISHFGKRKYKDYNSFRVMMSKEKKEM